MMSAADYTQDLRVVMTLDAGGTSFRFSAMRGGKPAVETVVLPAGSDDLKNCLLRLVEGFRRVRQACPEPPAAISFAFPGPADYPRGIIGDLLNLPCFRGGVALGPMLKEEFGVPVFINNDGDLFAYGEAMGGFLPQVNDLLAKAGSPKRFSNLLGVTIGTGLGGGIVRNGELFLGDNSMAGEIWLLRSKLSPAMNAEEGASIRAVRRVYAERAGVSLAEAPEPVEIHKIVLDQRTGDKPAAVEAFRRLGEMVGDAMGNALTLVDGLAVIGGGLAGAASLFLPALVEELNGEYALADGKRIRRLGSQAFNLEEADQLAAFLKGGTRKIEVPRASPAPGKVRTVQHDPLPRIGVGLSRLGTSQAVALGAYAFALRKLDDRQPADRPA
jgi:glucokinase